MPLAFGENLFGRRDVRETPAGTSTSTSSTSILAPVGSIMAWLKSFTNTPQALPTGWMECDGSAISDADSVYDGQNAPDLNGGEFIRGAGTSGGTGGSDTMAHTHTTNVTVGNHDSLTLSNHNAIAIDNHTALTIDNHTNLVMGNHTALTLSNHDNHTHYVSDTTSSDGGNDRVDVNYDGSTSYNAGDHTHTTSDTSSSVGVTAHSFSTNIDAHSFSTNIDAHSWGQNIDAHVVGTNIDAHSFSQNISVHSVGNPASDAASNTENRPKYYNVVWIFRFK